MALAALFDNRLCCGLAREKLCITCGQKKKAAIAAFSGLAGTVRARLGLADHRYRYGDHHVGVQRDLQRDLAHLL